MKTTKYKGNNMKTTKQVRAWLRAQFGNITVYTNKVKNPAVRHVKVYAYSPTQDELLALCQFAGLNNVRETFPTRGYSYAYGSSRGIIIRCAFE